MTIRKYAPRRRVVLDGPLIVHGGAGGEGVDGRRLASAFQWYEKLGYLVEATISNGKCREFVEGVHFTKVDGEWVKEQRKPIVGAASIKRLLADKKLFKFPGDDDKVMLDKCLEKGNESWIVTHDKFDDILRDGKVTKRQRSKYPELDWEQIDEFTRGTTNQNGRIYSSKHWYVEGKEFFDHEMPRAPPKILFGKFSRIKESANELQLLLSDIDGLLEDLGEKPTNNKSSMRTRIKKMQNQASSFIELIPNEELDEEEISALNVQNLRKLAKQRGLSGYSKLKKEELIQLIVDDSSGSKEISGQTVDDKILDTSTDAIVRKKTENIDPFEFFECLFSKIKNPRRWTAFTTAYDHMVKEKPEFHLKSMGVKTLDFLRLHPDKVEISRRKGHPWIRKK